MATTSVPRVTGHTLQREGAPFTQLGSPIIPDPLDNLPLTDGYGMCSCGALSAYTTTTAARKAWHRTHRRDQAEILAKAAADRARKDKRNARDRQRRANLTIPF